MSETLTPVYRIEHFIKAAADGTPCDLTPVFNEEVYLAKIAGADIDELPVPANRVQQYLAKIAGMDVDIPEPVFRNEMYLAAIAGMDIEAPAPFFMDEQFLADWVESSGGSVTLTVTGVSPLTLTNALAKPIKSLTQTGKCVTSGGDTYCNNGKLVAVDDELPSGYKRITGIKFDGDFWYDTGEVLTGDDDVTMTLANTATSGQNVFGSYNGTSAGSKNFSLYVYGGGSTSSSYFRYGEQLLRPKFGGNERTITFGKSGTSGFTTDVTATPETFTTVATAYIGMLPNSSSPAYTGSIMGSITVGTRLKWIPCERESDGVIGYYEAVNGVFLEPIGTGTPVAGSYDTSHLNRLEVVGTPEVLSVGGKNLNGGTIENKGYTSTGGESTSTTFAGTLWKVPCKEGDKFTVSWGGFPDGVSGVFINTWLTDGTWNARQAISASTSLTYTVGAGVGIINFTLYKTGGITIGDNAWLQVEYGTTATDYEPYVEPQTASVVDLFATDSVADEQDIISGIVTRKTEVVVSGGVITVSALAEPVTEQVAAQHLRTSAGDNSVCVTAEVEGVTLKVEYKGTEA